MEITPKQRAHTATFFAESLLREYGYNKTRARDVFFGVMVHEIQDDVHQAAADLLAEFFSTKRALPQQVLLDSMRDMALNVEASLYLAEHFDEVITPLIESQHAQPKPLSPAPGSPIM